MAGPFDFAGGGGVTLAAMNAAIAAAISDSEDDTAAALVAAIAAAKVGDVRLLWVLEGADMNVTTDQPFTKVGTFNHFILTNTRFTDPSTPMTTAAGGVYTGAGKTGDAILAAGHTYVGATTPATGTGLNLTQLGVGRRSDAALFLSLTTPQGAPATGNFYFLGAPLD